jgi:hypothetical protein
VAAASAPAIGAPPQRWLPRSSKRSTSGWRSSSRSRKRSPPAELDQSDRVFQRGRGAHRPRQPLVGSVSALNAMQTRGRRHPGGWSSGKSSGKRPAGVSLGSVLAGGRDRFRTCGLCRVKEAQSPHIQMRHSALHHNVAAQWLWRTEATQGCVWRREASFLANLWQGRVINQRGGWLAGPTAA